MKRSKLFLGITTAALAVAGVAAAKSMTNTRKGYYLTKGAAHNCLFFNSTVCPQVGTAPNRTCKVFIGGTAQVNLYTLYTVSDQTLCSTKIIYTIPE